LTRVPPQCDKLILDKKVKKYHSRKAAKGAKEEVKMNQFCYTLYQIDYTPECFRSVGGFTLANIFKRIQ